MKKGIIIGVIIFLVLAIGVCSYLYFFTDTFVPQEKEDQRDIAKEVDAYFARDLFLDHGVITGLTETVTLFTGLSGRQSYFIELNVAELPIYGFQAGSTLSFYTDFDANYYAYIQPKSTLKQVEFTKTMPRTHTVGFDGNGWGDVLLEADAYGLGVTLDHKVNTNSNKSKTLAVGSLETYLAALAGRAKGTLVDVGKKASLSEYFYKSFTSYDDGFAVTGNILGYHPREKRLVFTPTKELSFADIRVHDVAPTNRELIKRASSSTDEERYLLMYRQPLSGNVTVVLPDSNRYLYVTLIGAGGVPDETVFSFLNENLFVDYSGTYGVRP